MIEAWQVREVLRPRFGSALMDEPGAADRTAGLLNSYASYKDTFADMASRVEDTLFNMLYDHLGPSMTVRMDNGVTRRIHTSELKDAADDVMGVLFDQMKVYSVNYDAILPCGSCISATGIFCPNPNGKLLPGLSGTPVRRKTGNPG